MYLTIAQKDLQRAFSLVSAIVGQGNIQMPILKQLRLDAEPGCLIVQAANDDTRIHVRAPASVQAPGTLLVPAQTFTRFVSDLPLAPVTLMAPSPTDATALQLRCQQIKANFKQGSFSLAEFPQVIFLEEGEELLTLDCELLKEIIEQVVFAAATNASRPVLEGIRVALQNGSASFIAADTTRLATRTIPIPDQHMTAELLIPAPVLRQLSRLLPSSGAVRLGHSRDGRRLLVQTREMDLSSRLLEGAFPNIDALLRLEAPTRVILPTQDLRQSVHLIAAFAREDKQRLRCTVEASALLLEAEAADLGANEIRLTEEVTVNGPTMSILINHTYIAEALAAVPTPQVALEVLDARRPVIIKPVGPLDGRHIIMPLVLETTATPTQTAPEATAAAPTR